MHAILVVAHGETCHHKRAVPGCLGLATTRHSLYLSYLGLSLSKAGAPLHLTALRLQAKAACLWHTILIKTLTHSLIQGYIIFLALHRHPSTTAASCMQNRLLLCKHTPRGKKRMSSTIALPQPQNCISPAALWNRTSRPLRCMTPSFSVHFQRFFVRVTFSNCATTTLSYLRATSHVVSQTPHARA